ncbi:Uncharacterised protein [Pseudomonas putida]|nr:Uncharacterised protein [Pseudomonas putida]CAB5576407.1 Uncharacterised protein [Pseudomonas putida]CAB5621794.1 Uncharacterised protein [Pseudomonas putida]CAB5623434.1 Uncharacterised protein [Pseudomonas putida]CAB5700656.1 Uncharacterised protein [Pseudomonas putida]
MLASRSAFCDLAFPPITRWLEDETFYSVCSRQHCVLGSPTPSSTLTWLYNSTSATTTHDLPYNLAALNDAAKATWGDSRSIIVEHTILPLFLPFQSAEHAVQAVQAMEGPSLGSLKYRLGLLTGRFGAEHPLKACTACMTSDRALHGVAYWHLSHQYPGVIMCPTHHLRLRESTHNRQWSGRFQWVLPSEVTLAPDPLATLPTSEQQALERLASAVLELARYGACRRFDPGRVRLIYKDALSQREAGRVDHESIVASLTHHTAQLQSYPPLSSLPITTAQAVAFLKQFTRPPRRHYHPLKHLVLITWLFGALSPFVEAYDRLEGTAQDEPAPRLEAATKPTAVRTSDRDNTTLTAIAHRPKVLKPPIRSAILAQLRQGETKSNICAAFEITVSTINKLLRSEPLVQQAWIERRRERQVKERRAIWDGFVRSHPEESVKAIRSRIPNIYAWLYRNDRAWLVVQARAMPSGRIGNHSNVNWSKRDMILEDSIRQLILETLGAEGCLNVGKGKLFGLMPGLSSALEKRARYPRTRELLRQIAK